MYPEVLILGEALEDAKGLEAFRFRDFLDFKCIRIGTGEEDGERDEEDEFFGTVPPSNDCEVGVAVAREAAALLTTVLVAFVVDKFESTEEGETAAPPGLPATTSFVVPRSDCSKGGAADVGLEDGDV